jgi:hypothetical protein
LGKRVWGFSVSESNLEIVMDYVKNQDEHHRKKQFSEEHQEFIEHYELRFITED